jgi:hypothetical protein
MNLINHKLDKLFGPSFSYAGYVFMGAGIITLSYSYTAIVLIILGAFISLTYTGTFVDLTNRRIKPYTAWFGIIKSGTWIKIDSSSSFRIIKSDRRYTTYSRTNMRNDLHIRDLRLIVTKKGSKSKFTINKYLKYDDATKEMEELKSQLLVDEAKDQIQD